MYNIDTQCGRVCQSAMVDIDAGTETISTAAKGFVVNGLECICMPEAAVAGTTCLALEGCKSYDFDIYFEIHVSTLFRDYFDTLETFRDPIL